MEKAKYAPEEIERMIDEEIDRIDAANSVAAAATRKCPVPSGRSFGSRILAFLTDPFKRSKQSKN